MLLALLAPLMPTALAAPPDSFPVSQWDEWFWDDAAGLVYTRVHYPSTGLGYGEPLDEVGGPYPVIAFVHGYLGAAWMYGDACDHLASMGFIVLNMDTESGVFIDTDALALDTWAALRWVDAAGADPDHWLAGAVADGDWTAMGHSMGGISVARLVSWEPRVTSVVGFMPYAPEADEHGAYRDWDGAALFISGTEDETSVPSMVEDWFGALDAPAQGLYLSIEGAGHQAITDFESGYESMDDGEQRAAVLALAGDFVRARVMDEPDRWQGLTCGLPADIADHRSVGTEAVLWAEPLDAQAVRLGLAEGPGRVAVVHAGRGPGTTDTPRGTVDLRDAVVVAELSLADGVACAEVALPDDLAGLAWVQVIVEGDTPGGDAAWTDAIDVFGVGDPGPADSGPDDSGPDDSGTDDTGGTPQAGDAGADPDGASDAVDPALGGAGCRSVPAASALLLALVAPLLPRRRR